MCSLFISIDYSSMDFLNIFLLFFKFSFSIFIHVIFLYSKLCKLHTTKNKSQFTSVYRIQWCVFMCGYRVEHDENDKFQRNKISIKFQNCKLINKTKILPQECGIFLNLSAIFEFQFSFFLFPFFSFF